MTLPLSVLITSLPFPFEQSLREIAQLGFTHVDLVASAERRDAEREALAASGLIVACMALGRELPDDAALDAADTAGRRRAVEHVERQIVDAAQLGARVAYLVPCKTEASLPAFTDACAVLAGFARGRMIQLCVEHFPGSALSTARATLDWLQELPDVNMVLDLGHCLISKEDPAAVIAAAGARLGYVQLDDNDGINDLHWPLLTGVLPGAMLHAFPGKLRECGYKEAVALELNGKLPDALTSLTRSKAVVERVFTGS